jgi:hypothetical protein
VNHKAWKEISHEDPKTVYGEIRPVCGNVDKDGREEILVSFGPGGSGWMQVFDDTAAGYDHMASLRVLEDNYNTANGGSWPAIKSEGLKTEETTACLGDFDGDGDVDGSDIGIFSQDFGRENCGGHCPGDLDGDGDVDNTDMGLFVSEFGRTDCSN